MLDFKGTGMSVMEISHRSKEFEAIHPDRRSRPARPDGIPANYKIMFLQGGASLQFAMLPMNLRPAGASADYIVTGTWSKTAFKEAQKLGTTHAAANLKPRASTACRPADLDLDPQGRLPALHIQRDHSRRGIFYRAGRARLASRWSAMPPPISSATRSMSPSTP